MPHILARFTGDKSLVYLDFDPAKEIDFGGSRIPVTTAGIVAVRDLLKYMDIVPETGQCYRLSARLICAACKTGFTTPTEEKNAAGTEHMHWSCFHMLFEHQGMMTTDDDSSTYPCSDPNCPNRKICPETLPNVP